MDSPLTKQILGETRRDPMPVNYACEITIPVGPDT